MDFPIRWHTVVNWSLLVYCDWYSHGFHELKRNVLKGSDTKRTSWGFRGVQSPRRSSEKNKNFWLSLKEYTKLPFPRSPNARKNYLLKYNVIQECAWMDLSDGNEADDNTGVKQTTPPWALRVMELCSPFYSSSSLQVGSIRGALMNGHFRKLRYSKKLDWP